MKREIAYKMLRDQAARFCDNECPEANTDRCCCEFSCKAILSDRPELKPLYDESSELPFLCPANGCRVPPHLREYCTVFVCVPFMASKYFPRYLKIIEMLPIRDRRYARETVAGLKKMEAGGIVDKIWREIERRREKEYTPIP